MNDLPFGLESKHTFATLSPADLQSLGKRASVAYLSGGTSLNDAIVKLAREYPSISPHQVQRVVEFANQETFARLFSDNEKYASDKNIEFDVADPGDVLLELNNGACPTVMSVPPDEYSQSPVKLSHSNVEADVELARIFGVDPALPGMDKTAAMVMNRETGCIDRILLPQVKEATLVDRILSTGKSKQANLVDGVAAQPVPAPQPSPQQQMQQMAGGQPGTRAEENGNTHNDQMLELQREIELAKKRQELQKVEQQTIDQMNPQGQPGAVQAPIPAGGPGPDAGAAAAPQEQMAQQGGPVEAAPMPPEQQIPPEAAGAITAPPGSEPTKMGSALVKQAMAHVKSHRPNSDLLLKAASESVSFDSIKAATAHRGEYPMANPWGEVIRSKQKLATLLDDAAYARAKSVELYKEAETRFEHMLAQHLHDGGNLGEVGHLLAMVNGPRMKTVLASAMPYLIQQGLDPVKASAEAIQYEMEKSAGARTPNLEHPLADAYATLCKLARSIPVLDAAWAQLKSRYDLVENALGEAMTHAASR